MLCDDRWHTVTVVYNQSRGAPGGSTINDVVPVIKEIKVYEYRCLNIKYCHPPCPTLVDDLSLITPYIYVMQ